MLNTIYVVPESIYIQKEKPMTTPQTHRITATVSIDVTNAESEAQARETAFAHLTAAPPVRRGRTPSGPRCAVTGVSLTSDDSQKPGVIRNMTAEEREKFKKFNAQYDAMHGIEPIDVMEVD